MRKLLTFNLLILFFLTSCKSKEEQAAEKLREDLKTYFVINLKDSTATLDSFRVVKIDTITQRMILLRQGSILQNELNNVIELYRAKINYLEACINTQKTAVFLESDVLNEIHGNNVKKAEEQTIVIKTEIDTLLAVIRNIHLKASVADSTKPIAYQAICAFQERMLDKSVHQDTTYIILNTNKDIVKEEDFLKIPYTVNYDKLK